MADIRELMILSPGVLETAPERGLNRWLTDSRMALRRAVVKSSRNALLRRLYLSLYDLHLWVATQLGRRYAGTRAVYLSSGMASGEWTIGISDIDIAIYGDWPDKRQFKLMKIFGLLTVLSPLFDRRSLASISSVDDMRHLCATDMFMALNHAIGARQWKLLYGEDVLAALPEISAERFSGCVYMDVRRWWSMLARTTFGQDITARDALFQNTICFKSVAGMLKAEKMLGGGFDMASRQQLIQQELENTNDATLRMLLESAQRQFLHIDRDPRSPSLHWFLVHAERFHRQMRDESSFASIAPMQREGTAEERFIAPETLALTQRLVEIARSQWKDFRAAYLTPAVVMSSVDSLALLLEVGGEIPSAEQLLQVCEERFRTPSLPQRLAVYLLLPEAAYQLDGAGALDFFHYTLTAQTAPDVFIALKQPGFVLSGEPRTQGDDPRWSRMAQELMLEELNARRGAYARFGIASRPTATENLRNLWRFLQLTVIEHSFTEGLMRLPTTFAAVRRGLTEREPDAEADLHALERACTQSLRQKDLQVAALLDRVYARFRPA